MKKIALLFLLIGCTEKEEIQSKIVDDEMTTTTTLDPNRYSIDCTASYEDIQIQVSYNYYINEENSEKSETISCKFQGEYNESISDQNECNSEFTDLKVFIDSDIPILSDGLNEYEMECE